MAQKAIRITNENLTALRNRFGEGEVDTNVPLRVGYYLVMDFGNYEGPYEMVTSTFLMKNHELGAELRNGFFELVPKK